MSESSCEQLVAASSRSKLHDPHSAYRLCGTVSSTSMNLLQYLEQHFTVAVTCASETVWHVGTPVD